MFLVGLTGGIASGKSTVSSIFRQEFGVPVVDADVIARKVVEPNSKGWKRVKRIFGEEILNADQTINRDKLGQIVFEDAAKRRLLNKALHVLIVFEILKQILTYFIKGYRYIILDVPLLFEAKMALRFVSYKLVVFCDEEQQISRLLKRNASLSEKDAQLRIRSQMSTKEKLKLADFCIDNSADLQKTREQCRRLFTIFQNSNKYLKLRFCLGFFLCSFFGLAFYSFNKLI